MNQLGHIIALAGTSLREPILYEITSAEPGNYELWCSEFQLYGGGASLYSALNELSGYLVVLYQDYAYAADDDLGATALPLKRRLLYLFHHEERHEAQDC